MVLSRVAVVTGANKGVGYHIAQSLVHSGLFSAVVLGCRDASRGQKAAQEIGGCAEYMPLEVGNAASADAFAAALVARHGRCDVLVNNAEVAFKDADPTPFALQASQRILNMCSLCVSSMCHCVTGLRTACLCACYFRVVWAEGGGSARCSRPKHPLRHCVATARCRQSRRSTSTTEARSR